MAIPNTTQETQQTNPWQLQAQQAQQDYKDFRDTYGREPDDNEFNSILQGRRWAVQSTMLNGADKHRARTQTVFGMGGAFGDIDKYTRNALEQNYQKTLQQQAQQEQQNNTFTQRAEDGTLPQDAQAYILANGRQVTGQDIQALQYLLKQQPSPERDQAISNALQQYYNIKLPQEGTIEQRITNLLNTPAQDTPVDGETEEQKQQRLQQAQTTKAQTDDALAFLLTQAGATLNQNGQLILPHQLSEQEARQKVDDLYRKQDEWNTRMQSDAINRKRTRQSLAALGRIIGEMVQAAGGAKVLPNDLTAAYNQLDEQQQKLYDNYWARLEADRQRRHKEQMREMERQQAREQRLQDIEDERQWQLDLWQKKQLADEKMREADRKNAITLQRLRNAALSSRTNTKEKEFVLDFGIEDVVLKGEEGFAKANDMMQYMIDKGIIPETEYTVVDGNKQKRMNVSALRNPKSLVYRYLQSALKDPAHARALYKIATGQEKYFGDAVSNSPLQPEDETPSYDLVTGYAGQPSQRSNANKQTNNTGTSSGSMY